MSKAPSADNSKQQSSSSSAAPVFNYAAAAAKRVSVSTSQTPSTSQSTSPNPSGSSTPATATTTPASNANANQSLDSKSNSQNANQQPRTTASVVAAAANAPPSNSKSSLPGTSSNLNPSAKPVNGASATAAPSNQARRQSAVNLPKAGATGKPSECRFWTCLCRFRVGGKEERKSKIELAQGGPLILSSALEIEYEEDEFVATEDFKEESSSESGHSLTHPPFLPSFFLPTAPLSVQMLPSTLDQSKIRMPLYPLLQLSSPKSVKRRRLLVRCLQLEANQRRRWWEDSMEREKLPNLQRRALQRKHQLLLLQLQRRL